LKNELGISTSLPAGEQYLCLEGQGADLLITCPGPEPLLCVPHTRGAGRVFLLRVLEIDEQMPDSWHAAIPLKWQDVSLAQAHRLLPGLRVLHYSPATRIFPSIFAPLLARRRPRPRMNPDKSLWLPGPQHALILPELADAAKNLGFAARRLPGTLAPQDLEKLLGRERPSLLVSVNFHGLDPYGENLALLQEAGVPVAVWCVDNPLHLLSNQKNRLWQKLPLFVTDDWFVPPLRAMGADARHLPLAASARFFAPGPPCPAGADLVFVGRSAFPDKDRFFAACRVPQELAEEAAKLPGREAHFGWWSKRLQGHLLWPGSDVRIIGLGTETASARWRQECLRALADQTDLTVVGDAAWQTLLPGVKLLPPVDYYAGLADVYRRASFSLNLTSLLLPHGLTQRHFDVWACGGFLLTDNTPGMHIFPQELAQAVTFASPDEAARLARSLAADPGGKEALRRAWQQLVTQEHSYSARLSVILKGCLEQSQESPRPPKK
jgi:spore maturation protein CgeB